MSSDSNDPATPSPASPPLAPSALPDPAEAPQRGRLRRADKIMSGDEIDAFLATALCGRTATVDAEGYPYLVPNLFVWRAKQVFLHTAQVEGHFIDNVRHSDRVCFEVDEVGEVYPYGPVECDTTVVYSSVIVFGRIRLVTDEADKVAFYEALMAKYAPADSWGRERGTFPRLAKTIVYAIAPEVMTGKRGPLPALDKRWTGTP
jgi:nitroimidazol reductase NimA-like FMN-containing flavoprotein (pyridoxamine 5'-phosphate oxidase superfamily)